MMIKWIPLLIVLLASPFSVRAAEMQVMTTQEIADCSCVVCTEGQATADSEPAYCGSKIAADAFVAKYDADKGKDSARCNVVRGKASACPIISRNIPYAGSVCEMNATGDSVLIETVDANGITCRQETCRGNGCTAPGWQQVIYYKPFNQVPISRVKDADRDLYYAYMNKMQSAVAKSPKDVPYAGSQDFCLKYPGLTQLNSTTCVGAGGRLDIDYGSSGVTLLYKNGVTLPVATDIAYRDMPAGMIRAIPYAYRDYFNGGRP